MKIKETLIKEIVNSILNGDHATEGEREDSIFKEFLGCFVIVRTYSAGVFYGILEKVEGDTLILNKCRRIWCWYGAKSLSDIALYGVSDKEKTRICSPIDFHLVKGFIEIIPLSKKGKENLNSVVNWSEND